MRIKERIQKSGFFWLPSAPDKKIPGTLSVTDGGNIELEVVGLFDDSLDGINKALNGKAELERIVGEVETFGYLTLDACFYKKAGVSFGGISKSIVCVNFAYMGVAYDDGEAAKFSEIKISIEGLSEWVGISGIGVENDIKAKSSVITYKPPEELSFELKNGLKLLISYSWTLPRMPVISEASINQKTYLRLVSAEDLPLSEFIHTVYAINTLLCFAIDETVCIEKVTGNSKGLVRDLGGGITAPIPIEIFYGSLPFDSKPPRNKWHRMLFRYIQLREVAEKVINNWIAAYETIEPALNLYFSVRTGTHKYLDSKFLALAQGLETLHRRTSQEVLMEQNVYRNLMESLLTNCPSEHQDWLKGKLLYGNELPLRRRLKQIIEPFKNYIGDNGACKSFVSSIVDTRNYLTHYDESNKGSVVRGKDLWPLCLKMEAIFQLHLLKILGFTNKEIDSVFQNSFDLKSKFQQT